MTHTAAFGQEKRRRVRLTVIRLGVGRGVREGE
jgi:hypothetical protein